MEEVKSWKKLLEAGQKVTESNRKEEERIYPLRREFNPVAPDIAKSALKRDFEVGLVYPVDESVEKDRELSVLERRPPTAHLFKEALERKRKILEGAGIMKEMGYEKDSGKFKY
jgi:heterodisulfide reductase subunit C